METTRKISSRRLAEGGQERAEALDFSIFLFEFFLNTGFIPASTPAGGATSELELERRSQALQLRQLQLQAPDVTAAPPTMAPAPPGLLDSEAMSTAPSNRSSAVEWW